MPETYVIKDQFASYWVDLFTRRRYRDIIVNAFNYCVARKELQVHGWVIMSNHIHCILSSRNGRLSDTIRDLKAHTARTILQSVTEEAESRREWLLEQFSKAASQHVRNKEYQIWTHENHAVEKDPHARDMGSSKLDYIHENPVEAGWVENAEDYLYCSARDYAGKKGLISIEMW